MSDEFGDLELRSQEFLHKSLIDFNQSASDKFIKGQKEHGGYIADRPMLKEMKQEIIDLWMYFKGAEERQRKLEAFLQRVLSPEEKEELRVIMNVERWET